MTRPVRRPDRGASAVEFALVMPILIMLVFGIISYGIVFAQMLALGNGAREAARYGVVENRTCGQIATAATDASNTIAMSGADVSVTITRGASQASATAGGNRCGSAATNPCEGSADGDSLYVRLDFTSEVIIPLAFVDDTVDIDGRGVFRCEYS